MLVLLALALQTQTIRAWQPDFTVIRDITFYEHGKPISEKYESTLTHKQGIGEGIDVYSQTFTNLSTKETSETYLYRLENEAGWARSEGGTEKERETGKPAYEEKLKLILATSAGKGAKPVQPEVRKTIAGHVCALERWEDVLLDVVMKRRDYWMPVDPKVRKRVGALEFDVYEWDIIPTATVPTYSEVARKVTLAPRSN